MQTHRDRDMSSFASRPQETDLDGSVNERRPTSEARTLHVDLFVLLRVLLIV